MKISRILIILTIAVTLMACSLTINVPSVETGVTQTFKIDEALGSGSETASVNIEMGAGTLDLTGGTEKLVEGEVIYNVKSWKPTVTRAGNSISIKQENTSTVGIPDGTIKNMWTIQLGSIPMDLSLSTGAYEGTLDLSGLSITSLSIRDGASKSTVRFDTPNPVDMSILSYKTGASQVSLKGLGNANVDQISFDGGVGSYELDFTGDLSKDVNVTIKSGMSDIKLVFPTDCRANVIINGGLSNVDINGTWSVTNNSYSFGTTGPVVNVIIEMAVGNLQLVQQ
ncbi:MAG: hypothetical protein KBF64_01785 [Anaerolineaceae bacterium]|nr:hypothetical protein [Anaerolineaceae bacterium]